MDIQDSTHQHWCNCLNQKDNTNCLIDKLCQSVGSVAVKKLQGPWFGAELRFLFVWSFVCSLQGNMVFFLEPPASSHIPKHSGRRIVYAKLPLGLNKNVNVHTMDPMQGDDPHPIHGVMDPIQGELCYPLLCSHNDPSQDTMLTNEDPTRQSNPGCCVDCHCISELRAYGTCLAPRS